MKKIIIAAASLILLGSSCTDLDEKLYDGIPANKFPENEAQISTIGLDVYNPIKEFIDNGGWWFAQEITTDEMVAPTRGTDWDDNGKWRSLQLHTWNNQTEAIVNMWPRFYRGIVEANKTIATVTGTDDNAKLLTAKFKVIRAYFYYLLIDNYGDVPYVTSFNNAEKNPFKNKRADIFNNIVKELEESIPLLKNGGQRYAINKAFAQMVLAKLYLNAKVYTGTAQWQKCADVCKSIIDEGYYSLATTVSAPFVTQNDKCPENIFTIYYDGDVEKPQFNLHMRTLNYLHNRTFDMTVGPWNGFATLEDHFNRYADNDLRKNAYFIYGPQFSSTGQPLLDADAGNQQLNCTPHIPALQMSVAAGNTPAEIRWSGARVKKYEIASGAGQSLANDFVIFRLTDTYLMLAECLVNGATVSGKAAKDYLNPIRERAGLSPIDSPTVQDVKNERTREMFYEGHRRQDMIRWGIYNTPWWSATAGQFNTSSDANTFPIPKPQSDSNPNLLQPAK